MSTMSKRAGWVIGGGAGAAAILGLGYAASRWYRYGRVADDGPSDPLLDRFMPTCEVRERHQIRVAAPAAESYAAACALDLERSRIIRAIFRGRELLMGADGVGDQGPEPLLRRALALGWGLLAEDPGHEVVVGSVTRPWEPDVRFWSLPPDEFATFDVPGYAKIVWTLAAEPRGPAESVARTETRVATTDARARRLFRRYWALFSPGILLIGRQSLRLVKEDAERRYREQSDARRAAAAPAR